MSGAHIAVICFGATALAESSWGLSSPEKLKETVKQLVDEAPPVNMGIGLFFAVLVAGIWILISPERRLVDLALMLLSWVFAGGALANFLPHGFSRVMQILILGRSLSTIRLFYGVECIIALVLIGIGIGGL